MNLFINGTNIFLIILITFLITIILIPVVRKLDYIIGAIDKPGKRKIHHVAIPTMGGLAIYIAFLIGFILFVPKNNQTIAILVGSIILVITGMFDDISKNKDKQMGATFKFIIQIIAATLVVVIGNMSFNEMKIFGMTIKFGILSYPIAVLFIVAITNAINLTDGMDGLASGTSCIYFITIAIIGYIMNSLGGVDVSLSLIMIGCCLGYLTYNFPPAKIYMGDTGSYFLGLIISSIALLGFKTATITSLIIPILILFVPIIDTALAMLRRTIKGKKMFSSDAEHLHHQFLKTLKSTAKALFVMYAIDIIFALISIFYTLKNKTISIILYIIIIIIFIIIIYKTNILYDHVKEEKKK